MKSRLSTLIIALIVVSLLFPSLALAAVWSTSSITRDGVTLTGRSSESYSYSSPTRFYGYAQSSTSQNVNTIYSKTTVHVWDVWGNYRTGSSGHTHYNSNFVNAGVTVYAPYMVNPSKSHAHGYHTFKKWSTSTTWTLATDTDAST